MNSVLPNMRLICLPSEGLGEDWFLKSLQIEAQLPSWGMDLAEESIYLLYDRSPGPLLHGEGTCLIGRSVIGPKKGPSSPYILKDWVATPVYRKSLAAEAWPKVFAEAFDVWQDLKREGKSVADPFILGLKRRMDDELHLSAQVFFTE